MIARALRRGTTYAVALVLALAAGAGRARAREIAPGSAFALPHAMTPDLGGPLLAQRAIDRRWGPSEDSTYREISVKGWKSEGGALAMSFVLPGAGQAYVGEQYSYLFLVGEAVGLYETWALKRNGDSWERKARAWAGDPNQASSRWSFASYETRTQQSADALRSLYRADPSLFYFEIGRTPDLASGWVDAGSTIGARGQFVAWSDNAEERRKRSRYWRAAVWANHVVSAFEALRAARLLNMPLRHEIELRLKSGWGGGGPELTAALERSF